MRTTIALVLAALCSHADAEPDKAAANQEATIAGKLYESNQYRDAAEHFMRAYDLDPQAAYLFDAAQAYRFAKDCASSAKVYRQFLDVAKQAQVQNLDKVKHYIAEMDQCAKVEPAKPLPETTPKPQPEPPKLQPEPPNTADLQPLPPPPPPDPGAGKRHLGIAVGAAGVVLVGLGAYTYHWVGKVKDERDAYTMMYCSTASPCDSGPILKLDDRGHKDAVYSITELSVGGVAVAAGVALYVLGSGHSNGEHPVAIVPTGRGALLSFTF